MKKILLNVQKVLVNIIIKIAPIYRSIIRARLLISSFDERVISKYFLAKFLPKNPLIIEIGAHVGTDTVEMAVIWPKSRIYAFEPLPDVFSRLIFKTSSFNNIEVIQAAITDEVTTDKQKMYISNNSNSSSSLLKPKDHLIYYSDIDFTESPATIDTVVLHEWLAKKGINKIDLIWIDAQGMELNIFMSLNDQLRLVDFIYTEVSLKEFYEGSGTYREVKDYLRIYGFELIVDDLVDGQLMGNALFKRSKI